MRLIGFTLILGLLGITLSGCGGSGKGPVPICDTSCLKDTIRFTGDHETKPQVAIAPSNCSADTLLWTYQGLGVNRKIGLSSILPQLVPVQASHTRCFFNGNKTAWLFFNDCATGRGYQVKLPYDKSENISVRSSGINSIDPKFDIDSNLMAYTDRGNIYVVHLRKETTAMMTFQELVPIDYDHIHDHIDSVRIRPNKIWVRIKIQDQWKTLEKDIEL
jgi:hypothetical protein